eukprot:1187983-Prorocentrum_minimum.AAC.1
MSYSFSITSSNELVRGGTSVSLGSLQENRGEGWTRRSAKRDRLRRQRLAAEERAANNPDVRCAPAPESGDWAYRIIDAVRQERVQVNGVRLTQRQWRVRWEGAEGGQTMGSHVETTGVGEVVALKDILPVRPSRSRDPAHEIRVLTKVWHRPEAPRVSCNRYDKAEESDEKMDLQGLGDDLFFEEAPAPHVRMRERQSDLSAAADILTIHTDEVHPDRDIVGTGGLVLVRGTGPNGVEVYGIHKPDSGWVGDIEADRTRALFANYSAACRDPAVRGARSPGTFPHKLGRLLMRYRNGCTADKGRKVKISNLHWTTDDRLLRGGLCGIL